MDVPLIWPVRRAAFVWALLAATITVLASACNSGGGGSTEPSPQAFEPAPADAETNVSEYAVVKIQFPSAMDPATLTPASFVLLDPSGATVAGTYVEYRDVNVTFPLPAVLHVAILVHPVLLPATRYTARLTTAVKDASGQALSGNYDWSFTTRPDPGSGPGNPWRCQGCRGETPLRGPDHK